jgi:hypothetical protein
MANYQRCFGYSFGKSWKQKVGLFILEHTNSEGDRTQLVSRAFLVLTFGAGVHYAILVSQAQHTIDNGPGRMTGLLSWAYSQGLKSLIY